MVEQNKRQIGSAGELAAKKYLQRRFYRIEALNFSTKYGELDIVASKGRFLVFVEVKTRSPKALSTPSAAVTKAKQERIFTTASYYIKKSGSKKQPRFDVIEVITDSESRKIISINHIKNAFIQGGDYAVF